jgi:hypothetical protein
MWMKTIPLTRGKVALVDDEDYERVTEHTWIANRTWQGCWYSYMTGNPWISMHRFIMGKTDGSRVILHLNDDGLDNRRSNLKIGTDSDNQHIRHKDAKGYHWDSPRKKWKAMICIDHKAVYLGRFDREEDAAMAYKEAKQKVLDRIFGTTNDDADDDA